MKRLCGKMFQLALGIVFIFSFSPQVFAQEDTADEFMLEEITVTAEKRVQNQQKVPIAMDTISGEILALEGSNDVDDILRTLPNVTINTMSDGMRVSIRGITDTTNLDGGTNFKSAGSMVGINIDGAQNNSSSAGQNLFDVERVEVLYGPQSTLYGSNSPGGIVNVVTASPKMDKYSASFNINYGSYNYLNLQTALNAPVIADTFALRLSANKTSQDAFIEDNTGTDSTAVRLKALWQVNEDLSVTVTPSWSTAGSAGMMSGNVKPFAYQDGNYADGSKVTDPWTAPDTDADSLITGKGADDRITTGLSGDVSWNTSLGAVSFVPSYSESSSDTEQYDQFQESDVVQTQDRTETSAEFRVTNPEDFELFEWILGATYNENKQEMSSDYADATIVDRHYYRTAEKKALYGNVTYPLWFYEDLALTLGYRYGWDETKQLGSSFSPDTPYEYRHVKFAKPDVKFGFDWDTAENLMVYGSYANSYRSGSKSADAAENLQAYTVGAKSRFFDNKLQLNASIFYYDYENKEQRTERRFEDVPENMLATYDTLDLVVGSPEYIEEYDLASGVDLDGDGEDDGPDGVVDDTEVQVENAGSRLLGSFDSIGVDLSATWIMTSVDKLDLGVSYLKGTWSDLTRPADDYYPGLWPAIYYEGDMTDNSPELTLTAAYNHNFILGAWGTLIAAVDGQYKSDFMLMFDPEGAEDPDAEEEEDKTDYNYQEAYYLWNASVTYNSPSGKWSLNAAVKNIANYAVKKSYTVSGQSSMMMLGDPRTYQIGLSMKF